MTAAHPSPADADRAESAHPPIATVGLDFDDGFPCPHCGAVGTTTTRETVVDPGGTIVARTYECSACMTRFRGSAAVGRAGSGH